jgi:hypothetical protein
VGAGPGLAPAGHLLPRDELAAALLDGLLALELVDDAVQGGRVDAELGARLADGDAGPLADEAEQLRAPVRARAARLSPAPRAPGRAGGAGARARRRGAPGVGARGALAPNAEAVGDLLQLAVLGDGGLELLEAPDDTLLEVSADPRPAADARAPGVRRRRGPG